MSSAAGYKGQFFRRPKLAGVSPTRAESKAATRERILSVAHELFTTQRVVDVSLDHVAQAAGYTKGAVYSNFSSKTDLLFSVLERYLTDVGGDYQQLTVTAPLDELGTVIGARAGESEDGALGYFRLLTAVWVEAVHDEEFAQRFVAIRRAHRRRVADAIRARAADAEVELSCDADDLAAGLVAMSIAAMLESLIDPEVSSEDVHRVMVDLVTAGVLATGQAAT